MKHTFLWVLLVISACSHKPETSTSLVEYPFSPELLEQIQKKSQSREPAGFEALLKEGKSPRRIYFSALYQQFLAIGSHLGVSTQIDSCPQFHHDKLVTDKNVPTQFVIYTQAKHHQGAEYFPELAFSKTFTLEDHFEGIQSEVYHLCEEGFSDNYFKFDNLVTHYADKVNFHKKPDSMKSILKIPVFANYYLLKMLRPPHSLAKLTEHEKELISITKVHWLEAYVREAYSKRNLVIKNHMVLR